MNSFSFFNTSSYNPLSISSTSNNDLFPSTIVVAPKLPNDTMPNVSTPVFVFPQVSQLRF